MSNTKGSSNTSLESMTETILPPLSSPKTRRKVMSISPGGNSDSSNPLPKISPVTTSPSSIRVDVTVELPPINSPLSSPGSTPKGTRVSNSTPKTFNTTSLKVNPPKQDTLEKLLASSLNNLKLNENGTANITESRFNSASLSIKTKTPSNVRTINSGKYRSEISPIKEETSSTMSSPYQNQPASSNEQQPVKIDEPEYNYTGRISPRKSFSEEEELRSKESSNVLNI